MGESKKPWWYPVICNSEYFAGLREDYPEKSHLSDDELHEYYNDGLKYRMLWDHIGDAYSQFEPLADAFLLQITTIETLEQQLAEANDTFKSLAESFENTRRQLSQRDKDVEELVECIKDLHEEISNAPEPEEIDCWNLASYLIAKHTNKGNTGEGE